MFGERSIVINRPAAEVYAFVADPRNNPLWNGMVVESAVMGDGPIDVGTEFRTVAKFLGKRMEAVAVITELEPDRRGCITSVSGPFTFHGCRTCEPVEGGTRFTQTLEAEVGGFFGPFAERIVYRTAIHQLEADLQMLKELLESAADSDQAATPTDTVSHGAGESSVQ